MARRLLTRLGTLRQLEIFMKVAETRSIARPGLPPLVYTPRFAKGASR